MYDYVFSLKCNLGVRFSMRVCAESYNDASKELWRAFSGLPGVAEREGHDAGYTVLAWGWRPHSEARLPNPIRVDAYTCEILKH